MKSVWAIPFLPWKTSSFPTSCLITYCHVCVCVGVCDIHVWPTGDIWNVTACIGVCLFQCFILMWCRQQVPVKYRYCTYMVPNRTDHNVNTWKCESIRSHKSNGLKCLLLTDLQSERVIMFLRTKLLIESLYCLNTAPLLLLGWVNA